MSSKTLPSTEAVAPSKLNRVATPNINAIVFNAIRERPLWVAKAKYAGKMGSVRCTLSDGVSQAVLPLALVVSHIAGERVVV
jgi:hypothetical protein